MYFWSFLFVTEINTDSQVVKKEQLTLLLPILETTVSDYAVPDSSLRHAGEDQSEQICAYWVPD